MKSSFNAYGQSRKDFGAPSMPIWLGVVGPVPVGGTLASEFVKKGVFIPAGTPINLTNKVITPLVTFGVLKYEAGAENDIITVRPYVGGVDLAVGAALMKVGETFSTKGTAVAVTAVEKDGDDLKITIAHQASAFVAVGDALSEAASAGSSKALKGLAPNHYLYNDINLGDIDTDAETAAATGACVRYHADGILIDRTPAAEIAAACAEAIPGVLQVHD